MVNFFHREKKSDEIRKIEMTIDILTEFDIIWGTKPEDIFLSFSNTKYHVFLYIAILQFHYYFTTALTLELE